MAVPYRKTANISSLGENESRAELCFRWARANAAARDDESAG
jgi:hypothetical protein